ncbi:MAG: hypothetical protein H6711_16430 [Myxococcales bacterium]|nr:hypothetical protein [Myxococcales bacterium]
MSTTGLLLASAIVSLQPAPSADRGYAGPEAISPEEAAASGGVSSSGAAKSPAPAEGGTVEAEDLSLEDVFGPGPDADATAEAGAEGASEGPSESVESIDDVFGDGGGAAPAPEVSAAASSGGGESKGLLGGKLVLKARILSSVYYDIARTDKPGTIGRNENRLEFRLTYTPNKHIQIVGDIEPVFMGVSQARELDDLASMSMMNRFHVESRAAFVAVNDIVKGLDVKVGRQIVVWGTADKFSPTNNINPDDLEDRPLFTEPIANQMVVVDYAPLRDRLWFQGIYIPLFFPALLPPSAAAGLKDPYAEVPFASGADKAKIFYLQDDYLPANPKLLPNVVGHVIMPETTLANGQAAAKIGTRLADIDFSASYYYGRHDIPLPSEVKSTLVHPLNSDEPPPDGYYLQSDAYLIYPKMQVIGLDFTTQVPFLGNMGLWGEMGVFIPKEERLRIEMPAGLGVDVTPNDGMANPVMEVEGISVRKTPFIKATAGADYTIGKHVYVQAQYIRGFIDEFGADHVGNYLLAGTDVIFFGRALIFRTFGLVDFPGNNPKGAGSSGVIAPAILFQPPWGFLNFEIGSFAFLGQEGARTKFGQRAVGTSIAYLKVIGQF